MKIIVATVLATFVLLSASQSIVVNYGCKSYAKDGSTCLVCSDRYYKDSVGICQPVSANCKTYNPTTGDCLTCYGGYFLADVICVFGSLPSNTVDIYCLASTNGQCTQCSKGFYIMNGTCNMVNSLCKTFDYTKLVCVDCYAGYQLSSNGECQVEAINPSAFGCAQFNRSTCVKCSFGYYFDANQICKMANPLCKSFDATNGACLTCYAGFKLSQGNCEVDNSSNLNPYCQKFENSTCVACSKGYYFDANKVCQQVDVFCKTFDYTNNICTACYMGFSLVNGSCLVSNSTSAADPNCRSFSKDNVCLNCSNGYYFNQDKVCTQVNPNCKIFDYSSLLCTQCYNGYDLSSGNCVASNSTKSVVATCAQWLDNVCVKCVPRAYFDFNADCVMVSDACKTFNNFNGQCTSCYSGYALDANGACLASNSTSLCSVYDQKDQKCVKCYNGSYLNANGECRANDPFCATFNLATFACDACYKGYAVTNGICQPVPVVTNTIPNCVEYDNNQNCLKCFNLYYLSKNSCIEVNPLCKTYDSSNGNCLSCFSVFVLTNGACVLK